MTARYIIRLDDITPGMHWGKFWAALSLLIKSKVRPLLGVVPDNRDPKLEVAPHRPDFWAVVRQLHQDGLVDIAQHGYQHTLWSRPGLPIIGRRYGIKEMSEFAGDTYASQLRRIEAGSKILEHNGLPARFFMAPNHSFDMNTLRALKTCGFTAVSDGIALFPFQRAGVTLVPQQLWRPAWLPCGVATICLHTNEIGPFELRNIRVFLRTRAHVTRFSSEVSALPLSAPKRALNGCFAATYAGIRASQRACRRAARGSRPAASPEWKLLAPTERSSQSCQ